MARFVGRRLLVTIPTVFGVMTIVFLIVHLIPGDPVTAMLGDQATAAQVAQTRHELGLDQSLPVQFLDFWGRYARGDLGVSIRSRSPVATELLARAPYTLELALAGVLLSVLFGVPLGVLAAVKRGSVVDVLTLAVATGGVAAPVFWIGVMLSLVFATRLRIFPSIGAGTPQDPVLLLRSLVLPALTLGISGMALIARMARSSMLDVLGEDFVRTARAKGVPRMLVLFKHALRNAALPIVTIVGVNFGHLLGGAIVVETVFARPGLGTLLLNGILARDYPVVQGATLLIAIGFVVVNLLTDIAYGFLDPRVTAR